VADMWHEAIRKEASHAYTKTTNRPDILHSDTILFYQQVILMGISVQLLGAIMITIYMQSIKSSPGQHSRAMLHCVDVCTHEIQGTS